MSALFDVMILFDMRGEQPYRNGYMLRHLSQMRHMFWLEYPFIPNNLSFIDNCRYVTLVFMSGINFLYFGKTTCVLQ